LESPVDKPTDAVAAAAQPLSSSGKVVESFLHLMGFLALCIGAAVLIVGILSMSTFAVQCALIAALGSAGCLGLGTVIRLLREISGTLREREKD